MIFFLGLVLVSTAYDQCTVYSYGPKSATESLPSAELLRPRECHNAIYQHSVWIDAVSQRNRFVSKQCKLHTQNLKLRARGTLNLWSWGLHAGKQQHGPHFTYNFLQCVRQFTAITNLLCALITSWRFAHGFIREGSSRATRICHASVPKMPTEKPFVAHDTFQLPPNSSTPICKHIRVAPKDWSGSNNSYDS